MDSRDQHQQPKIDQGANVPAISSTTAVKGGVSQQIGAPRPTSTRWTPTAEQIRILRDLYYNYGVRSPNAEQIQRISARLRQFGKIEGKNVFYWFQNHKARERQKKRLASDPHFHSTNAHYGGMLGGAQMGGYKSGSVTMEKKFTECSLSASSSGGLAVPRVGWAAMDPSFYLSSPNCNILGNRLHRGGRRYPQEDGEEEEEEGEEEREKQDDDLNNVPEIETLPLFPMRDDEYSGGSFFGISPSPIPTVPSEPGFGPVGYFDSGTGGTWHGDVVMMAKPRASLELSLSSCAGKLPASF